jgi:hypothetical protein
MSDRYPNLAEGNIRAPSEWMNENFTPKGNIAMPPLTQEEVFQEQTEDAPVYESEPVQEATEPQQLVRPAQEVEEQIEERNFRSLRAEAQRLKLENARLLREREEIEEIPRRKKAAPVVDDTPDFEGRDDDLAELHHIKKAHERIRKNEQEIERTRRATEEALAELRLKNKFNDWDRVVSKESLGELEYAHPELFATLKASPDLYTMGVSAYTMIRKLGISQDTQEQEMNRQLAQRNSVKPRPVTSITPQKSASPLSKATEFGSHDFQLTPEMRKHYLREMNEAKRGS